MIHFWYSPKQAKMIDSLQHCYYDTPPLFKRPLALINGEKKVYTEAGTSGDPYGNWDDYEYLGHGTIVLDTLKED